MKISFICKSLLASTLLFFIGCNTTVNIDGPDHQKNGSGRVVNEERKVSDCSGIILRSAGNVFLRQGSEQSIRIEADDNIIDEVITRKEDGKLVVGLGEGSYSNITLRIYVTLKNINSISIQGAGNLNAQNSLNCDYLNCTINGAGNINIKGEGNTLDCNINGAGNINAEDFIAKVCSATVTGAGNCNIYASDELNASVVGVGNINYYGDPEVINTSVTGFGHIVRR